MSRELRGVDWGSILPTKLVATAKSLKRSKNNFRSFIYGQRFTNPANFAKIGPVDAEIIGLTEINKNIIKKQHNISHPRLRFEQSACAKYYAGCMRCTKNESVPIQLAQCWFPGLAISNAKI